MPLDNIQSGMLMRQPYKPPIAPARPLLPSAMMQQPAISGPRPQLQQTPKPAVNSMSGMAVANDFNPTRMSPFYMAMMRAGQRGR